MNYTKESVLFIDVQLKTYSIKQIYNMQQVVIKYKKMSKMLGVSVKKAAKLQDDLIAKDYGSVIRWR